MNKKGVTILELLISITLISIVILLLIKVIFSLNNINNDKSYASNDEISRTELIKNIESDLLKVIDGALRHDSLKLSSLIFSYLMRD